MTTNNSFHVRSISLPSRSHPVSVRVEEGLHKLKSWATSSLPRRGDEAPTAQLLCTGLRALEEMYDCVEELLRLPHSQRALIRVQTHEKWAAEELDCSVRLLDVCETTRDAVSSIVEHAQVLQSALRTRRAGDSEGQLQFHAFIQSRRRAQKEGNKCFKALKQILESKQLAISHPDDDDQDLALALKAIRDLREITIVVLRSASCIISNKRSRRWFPASSTGEFVKLEDSLRSIQRKQLAKVHDFEKKMEEAQRGLQSMEEEMGRLERDLASIFRRLIQNRVTLLNILSP